MIVQSPKYGKITLADTAFSSGGEGEVRNIVSPSHLKGNCVKIYYTQKRTKQQENKIKFMVDNPPQQVEQRGFKIGWAIDIIQQNNKFIGFMMPLAFPDSKKLVAITSTTLSKKLDYNWQKYDRKNGKTALFNRLKLMNNIAIPIHLLHQTGKYVLQDFKPDNVLITHTGQVTICDMDSIQITNGQTMLFHGTAATAGYAPPEFEKSGVGKSPTVPLQKSWDNFALSVVFYQLLFGLHPYAVTPKMQKNANSSEISTNISDDLFPFGANTHKIQVVPPLHDKFKVLPQNIQDLFKRAFSLNAANRPSADEWGKNIHNIIKNAGTISEIPVTPPPVPPKDNFIKCSKGHKYNKNLGKCPYCPATVTTPPKPKPKPKSYKWVWWLLLAIIALIVIIYIAVNSKNSDYGSNYQNKNTNTYTSGYNNVIVAETPAEIEVAVEEDNYDYTAVDTAALAVKESTSYYYSENVIYNNYTDGNSYATCNGIYPYSTEAESTTSSYFSTNLGSSLNRNHFKISCQFWVEEHRNQWALMLSGDYRILGINLNNGKIYISTNNQEKYHSTGETYQLSTWNYISVEYNYGSVRVNNGNWFSIDMNTQDGDNVLSSINYSSGNAFKGYLYNIYVANLE